MSLDRRFCVAPMMRYTDMHERFFLRLISKQAVLYTEMISTGALIHGNCDYQLDFNKEEHPVAVQFGGSSPQELTQCSIKAEKKGYDEINLNIGCPSERVQKGNFGVCLMLEPDLVAECARKMMESVDIPVTISMEVGRSQISIRNLLQLNQGSVVELDRVAGEPLDVLVNGTLIAHGEVVVVNDKFGIRLTDVISQIERIKKLR